MLREDEPDSVVHSVLSSLVKYQANYGLSNAAAIESGVMVMCMLIAGKTELQDFERMCPWTKKMMVPYQQGLVINNLLIIHCSKLLPTHVVLIMVIA